MALVAGKAALSSDGASAAIGFLRYGQPNDAGAATTSLDSTSSDFVFKADNSGAGAGLVGASDYGRALLGTTTHGIGVYAESAIPGAGATALYVSGPSIFKGSADFTGATSFTGFTTFHGSAGLTGGVTAASFAGNGTALTGLNAANLTGTVPDARLSANIPRLNAPATVFAGGVSAASLAGNGAGLSGLNAGALATGKVSPARLPRTLAYRSRKLNVFTGAVQAKSFAGAKRSAPAFPTVGAATIRPGRSSVHVVSKAVDAGTQVLVTLQSDPGADVHVKWVFKAQGSFDVFLTGPVKAPTTIGYFVVRKG